MQKIPVRYINTQPNELKVSENFSIREVSELAARKDMVQELHRHDFFHVLVLEKAKGNHEIDFIPYNISNHSVFFMRPGQVHQLKLKKGSTGFLLEFKNDFYYTHDTYSRQLLFKASNMGFYQLDSISFKKLLSALTNIFREYTGKQERYPEVIKANLEIFFIELLRHRGNRKSPANNTASHTQEMLEEFLKALETHISKFKKVSEYAGLLNLTPYQLNAITKSALGKTCSQMIDEQIILESKRYLLTTSNQVNQVAYYLGYEDISYFIRFFKKHTGFTPEAFRNNFR